MIKTKRITAVFLAVTIVILSFIVQAGASLTYKSGDLSGDGKISADDARLALRYSVDIEYYSEAHLKIGDINSDGMITALDARMLLRISVDLEKAPEKQITVDQSDFEKYVNKPENDLFEWVTPPMPAVNAPSGTFTFTYYGYGHGVGLSMHGALAMEDAGYKYKDIITHYYRGTEVKEASNIPATTYYPTTGYINTEQLLARIVYQEIYGVTEYGKYKEALKAMTLCVLSLLMREDFYVTNRWDVGIASSTSYYNLPTNLKDLVHEVFGEYITVKGQSSPIMAVYSGLAAGMTAASKHIWGEDLSYLQAVASPFDMKHEDFIGQEQYTVSEMRAKIKAYDSSIVLSDNPGEWLEISEHTGSIDANRGYVTKIRVGNKVLSGYNQFHYDLMQEYYYSSCFIITYTP